MYVFAHDLLFGYSINANGESSRLSFRHRASSLFASPYHVAFQQQISRTTELQSMSKSIATPPLLQRVQMSVRDLGKVCGIRRGVESLLEVLGSCVGSSEPRSQAGTTAVCPDV